MSLSAKAPTPPPNQWVPDGDLHAPFDVVTGNCRIDREIARDRGLYPRQLWKRWEFWLWVAVVSHQVAFAAHWFGRH